jgi:hypothetical protein
LKEGSLDAGTAKPGVDPPSEKARNGHTSYDCDGGYGTCFEPGALAIAVAESWQRWGHNNEVVIKKCGAAHQQPHTRVLLLKNKLLALHPPIASSLLTHTDGALYL